jgi:hypothetical protein
MKSQSKYLSLLVVILLLMTGGVGVLADGSVQAVLLTNRINYQGRLTDINGAPATGSYAMQFQIYDDPTAGVLLWDSGVLTVNVDRGLFNVALNVDYTDFKGQGLWLLIGVGGEWLLPRQELMAVPYALSLRPGAKIEGLAMTNTTGSVLWVEMTGSPATGSAIKGTAATGNAIYGNSNGYGVYGYSEAGNAIYGRSIQKTAGVFQSDEGYGIRVSTAGTNHWDHAGYFTANWGNGILVTSTHNVALRAESGNITGLWQATGNWGVLGLGASGGVFGSGGTSAGVRGYSSSSYGVFGESDGTDMDVTAGVWGYKGSGDGTAVRGLKYGSSGRAIYGTNWGTTGSGVAGDSTNFIGVWGQTEEASNNYGIYTPDNLYANNYHTTGAIMQVVQNGSSEPLEPGDVVAFSGITPPLDGDSLPTIQVTKVTEANSTAVAGVVYRGYSTVAATGKLRSEGSKLAAGSEITFDGPVAPGNYLLVVVQGPALVKASALSGVIKPGDLIASGSTAGTASRATLLQTEVGVMAVPGTVLGKALEAPKDGQGMFYIYVTLQ